MENFPIYTKDDLITAVGYYFERLGWHLLGTPEMSLDDWVAHRSGNPFDIDSDDLDCMIEIKGSSNANELPFFEDQLQKQLGVPIFPRKYKFDWIFTYNNKSQKATQRSKKKGKKGVLYRPQLLTKESGKSWDELSQFLAEHVYEAILIDVRLMEALYRQNGTRTDNRDCFNLRERVRINRTALRLLAENERTSLAAFGMDAEEISRWLPPRAKRSIPRTVVTDFDGRRVSFKLIVITPNDFKNGLLRRLNGIVKSHEAP